MSHLREQAVVITGAGRGLGAAYARAAGALGAGVVVNDIDPAGAEAVAAAIRAEGGRAVAEVQDVRTTEGAQALVDRCIAEFGAITGLVNNAAIYVQTMFEFETLESLRAHLEVNVVGVFNCSKAALGPMLKQGGGSIVNVTSGAQTGQIKRSSYGATKGAVASFTYGWAGELKDRGIRVNAISPIAATAMSLDRPGLPDPSANAPLVTYLLSDLSKHVTGQVIRIDTGKLSIMTHPANRTPVLVNDAWTLEAVAEAFRTTLADKLLPVNVATYDIASVTV
jgi:NAD(P)-dependent dehydrogenase (short-subunit alcohol dehydrogenase family)